MSYIFIIQALTTLELNHTSIALLLTSPIKVEIVSKFLLF